MDDILDELTKTLKKDGILRLKIKVVANAKNNSVEKYENMIKLKINKPAVDGKANKAIIEYLSSLFSVPKNNVIILRGEKSSIKDLQIILKDTIITK